MCNVLGASVIPVSHSPQEKTKTPSTKTSCSTVKLFNNGIKYSLVQSGVVNLVDVWRHLISLNR